MKNIVRSLVVVAMSGLVGLMAACGGGEDGGDGSAGISTILSGTASKGIIFPGSVTIFAVDKGVKSAALKTVPTDQNGKFTADLGQYKGSVVIEASGKYTDEASAAQVTIDAANPLRAAITDVGSVTGGKRCAITPLTDLAYSLMAGSLTNDNIGAANTRVAGIFKLTDITGTEPVKPDSASMKAGTEEQRVYTIALATLSHMAKNSGSGAPATFAQIKDIIGSFKDDLAASPTAALVPAHTDAFTAALATATAPTEPLGEFADSPSTSTLQNVNRSEFKLTLSAGTAPAGTLIGGIQGTITLPPGTSVRTKGNTNEARDGVLAAPAASLASAGYAAGTRTINYAVVYGTGFSGGDFATLFVDVQSGVSVTASSFTLSGSKAIDTNLGTMSIAITGK